MYEVLVYKVVVYHVIYKVVYHVIYKVVYYVIYKVVDKVIYSIPCETSCESCSSICLP